METIKNGDVGAGAGYVGTVVTCLRCNFQGRIQEGDKVSLGSQMDPADLIECPNCKAMIALPSRGYFGPG